MVVREVYGRYMPKPGYDVVYSWLCEQGWKGHRTDRKIGPLSKYIHKQTLAGEQLCYDFLSYLKSRGYIYISVSNIGMVQIIIEMNPLTDDKPDTEYFNYFTPSENLMRQQDDHDML